MRTGEACRLDPSDIDFSAGVLTIRDTKFGKHRQVPIHSTTTVALSEYLRDRGRLRPALRTPALFVSTRGTRLDHINIPHTFLRLVETAGIAVNDSPSAHACARRGHLPP